MRKIISLFLCLAVLLPLLTACRSSQQETTTPQPGPTQPTATQTISDPWADYNMPTADDDYWELLCENCDITIYLLSSGHRTIRFHLVSARDLGGETVTFTSNLGGTIERTISDAEKNEPTSMLDRVFLAYQGIDWAALKGDWKAYDAQIKKTLPAYNKALNDLPQLHTYVFALPFHELGAAPGPDENGEWPSDDVIATLEPKQIETLTVKIGDQTKTYSLGKLLILGDAAAGKEESLGGVTTIDFILIDHAAFPSRDGVMDLADLEYEITADVVLQSFTVQGAELLQCDVKIVTPQGDKYSLRWDGNSPLEVDEGSQIILQGIVLRDPYLAGKLVASIVRYAVLNYTNNGEEFNAVIPYHIRMRQNPWDAYAWYVDGVDMLPYYYDYKNYGE